MYIGAFMPPLYHLFSFLHNRSLELALGALALNDPLRDNSQGHNWQKGLNQNHATCTFVNGVYQSSQPVDGDFHACLALATDFSNFVYEVKMTISSGYSGGIIFRANQVNSTFYYFRVGQDGAMICASMWMR